MPTAVLSQELTPAEIESARLDLEQARDAVFSATEGLSEAQWDYLPESGGWSIAANLEHMVVIQEIILGPIADALANSAETSSYDAEAVKVLDALIRTKFPDRSRKFPSPESTHPQRRWTPSESLNRLSANTLRLIERLESTPSLRHRSVPSPPMNAMTNGEHKSMDGYQWILAVAAHTERHTRQILEITAEPGFPRNRATCDT